MYIRFGTTLPKRLFSLCFVLKWVSKKVESRAYGTGRESTDFDDSYQVQTLMSVGDFAPVLPRSKEKFLFKKPSVSVKRAASCASAAL